MDEPFLTIIHLGYQAWPKSPLPMEIATQATIAYNIGPLVADLEEPWLSFGRILLPDMGIVASFTDEWIELKMGLLYALKLRVRDLKLCVAPLSRASTEWDVQGVETCNLRKLAREMDLAKVVLSDCSVGHVLAAAMGKDVVVMEPSVARHNPIFRPACSRIHWVLGNDGQPTFDARHGADVLRRFL